MRALLPLALLLLVPAAAGQVTGGLELALNLPTAPIKPEVENPAFTAEVTVPCEALLSRLDPTRPQGTVQVTLEFTTASGVLITGPWFIRVDPFACAAGIATAVTGKAVLQITIPRSAPGLQEIPATARAFLAPGVPGVDAMESEAIPFTVTADAFLLGQVKMASKLQGCDGGKARYELEITNFGNVRTEYTFELASGPQGDGWSATAPEPIVLDTPNRDGGAPVTATVPFVVDCAFGNKEAAYQILIRSAAFDDAGKRGNPMTAQVLARSDPPLGIPGPGPLLLGLVLLGVALLLRRR